MEARHPITGKPIRIMRLDTQVHTDNKTMLWARASFVPGSRWHRWYCVVPEPAAIEVVGAGSVVTEGKVFPDNSLILGSPAKVVRELTPEAIAGLKASAENYVAKKNLFKAHLVELPSKS